MHKESMGQVAVISFDGEKYVIGKSLAGAAGITPEFFDDWFKDQIKTRKLVRGKDWTNFEEGILFSFEAAHQILEQYNKPKKIPSRERPKRSRYGHPLDEDGLPILPPEEHQGPWINPFKDLAGEKPRRSARSAGEAYARLRELLNEDEE